MALPAIDDFNRADGGEGANWTVQNGTINIVSNQADGTSGAGEDASFWNADSFPNDQYSKITDVTVVDGGPTVRCSNTGGVNYYEYEAKSSTSVLAKTVAGVGSSLQTGLPAPAANSVLQINVIGDTIQIFDDGVQVGTDQVDSSLTSGSAGKAIFGGSTTMDNFEGGSLAIAPPWGGRVGTSARITLQSRHLPL